MNIIPYKEIDTNIPSFIICNEKRIELTLPESEEYSIKSVGVENNNLYHCKIYTVITTVNNIDQFLTNLNIYERQHSKFLIPITHYCWDDKYLYLIHSGFCGENNLTSKVKSNEFCLKLFDCIQFCIVYNYTYNAAKQYIWLETPTFYTNHIENFQILVSDTFEFYNLITVIIKDYEIFLNNPLWKNKNQFIKQVSKLIYEMQLYSDQMSNLQLYQNQLTKSFLN